MKICLLSSRFINHSILDFCLRSILSCQGKTKRIFAEWWTFFARRISYFSIIFLNSPSYQLCEMPLKNYSFILFKIALVHSCIGSSFVYRDMIAYTAKAAGLLQQQ